MNKTIIIIHEIYGITDTLLSLKNILERKGFTVILPSLYEDHYTGNDEQMSYKKFFTEVGIEKGYRIIDGIIARNADSEIVLIGFSAGATIAWLHSTDDRINSIIGIYGSRIRDHIDITPTVPSHLFFCEEKSFDINPVIKVLEQKKNVEVETINGNHGFYNFSDTKNEFLIERINEEIFRIVKQDGLNKMNNLVIQEISRTIACVEGELNLGRLWEEPIIHFISSGNSELAGLKESVSPDHLLPVDILSDAESIISFFIPFHDSIVKSNIKNIEASKEWAAAYIYTNDLIRTISNRVEIILNENGYSAGKIPATHNFDRNKLISNWSHRHIAYIGRLGTFGINNMLITDKGCCGRLGSIITSCRFSYTPTEKLKEKCLNKADGSCGICQKKCIADAYAANKFDRHKCYEKCLMNAELHKNTGYADVCGKCLVGLPCSSCDPTAKSITK